ncbi:putative TATA element modulatory factor 1, TATA binding protein [Helianthus annuus]|uniref:Putative TATA element modulatory factor 1 TATA binding protein n=1 Tax=Helianthus annuus TaxID=4232 RepID=A0A251T1D1_HELAN|nr:golgin candidate 5 isoform X1 [Helianthus annuus]XP_021997115.1 golgin candidate 5 isoform X1 [Helianthus annuus]KAF5776900.1 putative TATA element modulatory factor 1, TATA binding protein [Helianthus annuus]KAJ0492071.1 putative TATA element modulatory factor 1, TATA binding protein [Helianthus annuus]KAJ0504378.1 putative TATA element modulatory factor 1, TATA binding protein [Helianthus annuus]KAJ0861740.1 putative TATA element modulatory factor 1, TATA binding protein [Helianthus annuu
MAWFSGNFPDFSEAVNKISAGVKTIEKNFDNALGLEENPDGTSSTSEASGLWSTDLMSFMGQKDEDEDAESSENLESSSLPSSSRENETDDPATTASEVRESNVETLKPEEQHQETHVTASDEVESRDETIIDELADELAAIALNTSNAQKSHIGISEEPSADHTDPLEFPDHKLTEPESTSSEDQAAGIVLESNAVSQPLDLQKTEEESKRQEEAIQVSDDVSEIVPDVVLDDGNTTATEHEAEVKEQPSSLERNLSEYSDSVVELENVKREMKLMETALLGAATQAQAKADELAKLMNENEQLKSLLEEQTRKSNEAEVESLREEYHQRVSTLERKVYALTRERDTLRREQNKKSDAAALLKEKDEIITQVMAEGEELSKKQAAQEATIRKLRAQIREFEEEKKGLTTKLQVEENKVESIKRDKAATEKLLQETIEKNHAELATQKEFYTTALNAAKEAEALAESRANDEARNELESRLKEAEEREAMLVQTLEELRQTLSRKEQQAVFKEDMLRRDIEDLQKRYQASERRCEELVTQVPESTRPLLRQIEAIQKTTARKAEAWNAVERSLNSRLQEAEAKAAGAEERERSVNERLSQTLSRINVLEAQISCLRTEQTQLTRSLEKERQRAAESRQDYLALKEEADTHEGRVSRLQDEIKELKTKHKQELQEALTHRELLQQDIEREKNARLELEKAAHLQSTALLEQNKIARTKSTSENGLTRRLSSASSLSSMEESFYLQASLDSSDTLSERRNPGETSYYLKSKTPNALEAALRHKEGELASYMSRLASMESIRDSLAEELVKMTAECEKLRSEVSQLPGMKAEMEALRRRHAAALELMGERDEELEELRADIVDLKEMYREQVNTLVNKLQVLSSSIGAA